MDIRQDMSAGDPQKFSSSRSSSRSSSSQSLALAFLLCHHCHQPPPLHCQSHLILDNKEGRRAEGLGQHLGTQRSQPHYRGGEHPLGTQRGGRCKDLPRNLDDLVKRNHMGSGGPASSLAKDLWETDFQNEGDLSWIKSGGAG